MTAGSLVSLVVLGVFGVSSFAINCRRFPPEIQGTGPGERAIMGKCVPVPRAEVRLCAGGGGKQRGWVGPRASREIRAQRRCARDGGGGRGEVRTRLRGRTTNRSRDR